LKLKSLSKKKQMSTIIQQISKLSNKHGLSPIHHCCFGTIAVVNPSGSQQSNNTKKRSKHRKQGNAGSYKFVDRAFIRVAGGNGGKGCLSYETLLGSSYKKKPDGGHGGHGGKVIILADQNEQSLNMQSHHFKAEDGKNGTSKQMHGRNGKDKIIRVPCGVVVKRVLDYDEIYDPALNVIKKISADEKDDTVVTEGIDRPYDYDDIVNLEQRSQVDGLFYWEQENSITDDDDDLISSSEMLPIAERETIPIADLDQPGSFIEVAGGGMGGTGNCVYAKRQFQSNMFAGAAERAKGEDGQVLHLELELKLIADVGLVGFPNAGKSSLLAAMSKAQPEIAPYPFTTLHPLVGTLEYVDGFRAILADVPGLIGGAALGRGRGHDFLKHIERTKALLYIVDAAGVDGRDPLTDISVLVDEIASYGNEDMMERPALVVANKMDLIQDQSLQDEILYALSSLAIEKGINFNGEVHGISAGVTGEGLSELSRAIRTLVEKGNAERQTRNQIFHTFKI
jgi:GTPase